MNVSVYIKTVLGVAMIIFFFYSFSRKEGFSSGKTPKDTVSLIASTNTTLRDVLNIPTYRSSYDNMIQDLDTWADYNMLNLLAQAKIGTDATSTSSTSIQQFNELAEFKKNLESFQDVFDKME